jgi:hypothetical protein
VIHGPRKLTDSGSGNGGPGEIRTPDLTVRSRSLYPTELRAPRDEFYYPICQKRKSGDQNGFLALSWLSVTR